MDSEPFPSSDFTRDADYRFPRPEILSALKEVVGAGNVREVRATTEAVDVFGDAIFANTILVGFASQIGGLPIPPSAFEAVLGASGPSGKKTLEAFNHGRALALRPGREGGDGGGRDAASKPKAEPTGLDAEIADFSNRLKAYQSANYARRFTDRISKFRAVEQQRLGSDLLTRKAALSLYRLMAYKDEYEVARLHLKFRRELKARFGRDIKINHHMAPPLLSGRDAEGHLKKRRFGPWIGAAFAALAPMSRLRGTVFDPFGYAAERKRERQLIVRFSEMLDEIERDLCAENRVAAEEIIRLAGRIRGYGHVKDASLGEVETGWSEARKAFRTGASASKAPTKQETK